MPPAMTRRQQTYIAGRGDTLPANLPQRRVGGLRRCRQRHSGIMALTT